MHFQRVDKKSPPNCIQLSHKPGKHINAANLTIRCIVYKRQYAAINSSEYEPQNADKFGGREQINIYQ